MEQRSKAANINFSKPPSLRPWCWCPDVPILGQLGSSRPKICCICMTLDNHLYLVWCTMSGQQVWKMTRKKPRNLQIFFPQSLRCRKWCFISISWFSNIWSLFAPTRESHNWTRTLIFAQELRYFPLEILASKQTTKYFQTWDENKIWQICTTYNGSYYTKV